MAYEDFINYTDEDKRTIITKTVNYISATLVNKYGFEQQKSLNFILFLLGCTVNVSGEYSDKQHDIFQKATGIPFDHNTLKNYYLNQYSPDNLTNLYQAISSYNDEELCTNIATLVITFIAIKGGFTKPEEEFILNISNPNAYIAKEAEKMGMKVKDASSLDVDEHTVSLVNTLLGVSLEQRQMITVGLIDELRKGLKDLNEDKKIEVITDLSSLAVRYVDLSSPEGVFSVVAEDIAPGTKYNDGEINEEEVFDFFRNYQCTGEACTYVLALISCSRTVSEEAMKFAERIWRN